MSGSTAPRSGGIWAVVLAAGASRRMRRAMAGAPLKQTLFLPDGRAMLRWVVDMARTCTRVDGVFVVVPGGEEAEAVIQAVGPLDHRVRVIHNPHFLQGQSTSLHAGIQGAQSVRAEAVLFLLADQPELSGETVDLVCEAFTARRDPLSIVQAKYTDGPGHPVLFGAHYFDDLARVTGDEGGRQVLRRAREALRYVTVDQPSPPDVDTPDAYTALCARLRSQTSGEELPL